jgi:hypothetical protein
MEQSSIDFGYIFPLSPNIPFRALTLISVHATAKQIIPGLLVILLHQRENGGGGDGDNREDTSYRRYNKHPILF